jgi:hypothetical protein
MINDCPHKITVPNAPSCSTRYVDGVNGLEVFWTTPNFDGGTPITGYKVEWNGGAGSDFVLIGKT